MRLLFVCPDMRTGGAERHWATLIPELHERGTAVKLLALADAGPFFDDVVARGVPTECLHLQRHTNPRALRLALSVGAAFEPDAVVTRGVSGQLVGEAIAGRADAVHVMNEHTPLTPDGRLVPPRPHQRALTRLVARRIDGVIAVTRRQVPPLEGLGYPRGRIEVVPNGVFERDVQGVEASPELANGFSVLCVSGLRREKRVDLFIEAVAAARRENPEIRGYVAGEGSEHERLERLAEGSGVTLLGVRRDVLELIRGAERPLPSQRGGGASDEHPRGDGARAAGGGHGGGRDGRAGGGRRDRPPGARRGPGAGPARAARARRRSPSAPARWALPGGGASASASAAS